MAQAIQLHQIQGYELVTGIADDSEPRISHHALAAKLDARADNVKATIERLTENSPEFRALGILLPWQEKSAGRGQPRAHVMLSETQVAFVAMSYESPAALKVRLELVSVWSAWRKGQLIQNPAAPVALLPTISRSFFASMGLGAQREVLIGVRKGQLQLVEDAPALPPVDDTRVRELEARIEQLEAPEIPDDGLYTMTELGARFVPAVSCHDVAAMLRKAGLARKNRAGDTVPTQDAIDRRLAAPVPFTNERTSFSGMQIKWSADCLTAPASALPKGVV